MTTFITWVNFKCVKYWKLTYISTQGSQVTHHKWLFSHPSTIILKMCCLPFWCLTERWNTWNFAKEPNIFIPLSLVQILLYNVEQFEVRDSVRMTNVSQLHSALFAYIANINLNSDVVEWSKRLIIVKYSCKWCIK